MDRPQGTETLLAECRLVAHGALKGAVRCCNVVSFSRICLFRLAKTGSPSAVCLFRLAKTGSASAVCLFRLAKTDSPSAVCLFRLAKTGSPSVADEPMDFPACVRRCSLFQRQVSERQSRERAKHETDQDSVGKKSKKKGLSIASFNTC